MRFLISAFLLLPPGYALAAQPAPSANVKIKSADEVQTLGVDAQGRASTKVHGGTDNSVIGNSGDRLRVDVAVVNQVSEGNSTSTPLAAGAVFTGEAIEALPFANVSVQVFSSHTSAVDGLQIQYSTNGVNWDSSDRYTVAANMGESIGGGVTARFVRVVYTNGATAQTAFRLQTILHPFAPKPSSHRVGDVIDGENDAELSKAVIAGVRPDNTYGNVPITRDNYLRMSVDAIGNGVNRSILSSDRSIFGAAITGQRTSQLGAHFTTSLATNNVTATSAGTGTAIVSGGVVTVSSGIATTAASQLTTARTLRVAPGREVYTTVTATFTLPSAGNTGHQRIGIYDNANGYFLGYNGTTFGMTYRTNGVDTFVPRASFNGETALGAATSLFTRNQAPEALDPTKLNEYRIRGGFGGGMTLEVLSADGRWVILHTLRTLNLAASPFIQSTLLPIRMEVTKTATSTQNLVMTSTTWDAGTVEDPSNFAQEDLKGRTYVNGSLAGATATSNMHTVSPGRVLRITGGTITVINLSSAVPGQLQIRDGATNTVLPVVLAAATNQTGSHIVVPFTLPTGVRFMENVNVVEAAGDLIFSIMWTGYESEY
jgi:hypothetical protein